MGIQFGDQVNSYYGFRFHSVKHTYLRLMLQTASAPNGHRAHAQRRWWGTLVTEEKHLSFPGSCRVTWHDRSLPGLLGGRGPAELVLTGKKGMAVDRKKSHSIHTGPWIIWWCIWPFPITHTWNTHTHTHTHTVLPHRDICRFPPISRGIISNP